LAQIRDVLDVRDAGTAPCYHVRDLLTSRLSDLDRQIADLKALRDTVADLHNAATTIDPGRCEPETVCRYV
jgi:DNA-binding transcriptional MerR regulator